MKLAATTTPRASEPAPVTSQRAGALRARWGAIVRDVRRGYLQMFGIADYDRYLAHHRAQHPEDEPLSRQQFHARAIDRKYCRSGPRCC